MGEYMCGWSKKETHSSKKTTHGAAAAARPNTSRTLASLAPMYLLSSSAHQCTQTHNIDKKKQMKETSQKIKRNKNLIFWLQNSWKPRYEDCRKQTHARTGPLDRNKVEAALLGDRRGQQRLAAAGRTVEHHTRTQLERRALKQARVSANMRRTECGKVPSTQNDRKMIQESI
jgi:hypothetical protein